jgi:NAD(P)-dependent dehydrogenase (short-subunit alcohol dehydrogenase family)
MLLKDKVVVVSGIGPGLGQELAFASAREGARVVLAARTQGFLDEIEAKLREGGCETLAVSTDISDRAQCKALIDAAVAKFGGVDVLINSAYSPGRFALFEDSDLDDWRKTMDVNLFGSLNLSQEVVPHMKKRGGGSIVMVNSMVQKKPIDYQSGYATSKGALSAAAKMLAKELGRHNIRVNSVFMGWMWGPPVEGFVNGSAKSRGIPAEQVVSEITEAIPLGFIPDDADCANAVIFFASDMSRVITGAGLDVNGGEFMPPD